MQLIGQGVRREEFQHTAFAPEDIARYRQLVWNIVYDSMSNAYPLAQRALGEPIWERLIRDFLREHNMQSNQYWETAAELLDYIGDPEDTQSPQRDLMNAFPFVYDLLYFEWLEIKYFNLATPDFVVTDRPQAPLKLADGVNMNPAGEIFRVCWPVHSSPPQSLKSAEKGEYYLFCFRNAYTLEIEYMELSAFHVLLLEQIETQTNQSIEAILEALNEAYALEMTAETRTGVLAFLEHLKQKGALMGRSVE